MKIYLASSSPRRKQLMELLGIDFETINSDFEESYDCKNPDKLVKELSLKKAETVFDRIDGDITVIGSDTTVYYKGNILNKPKSEEESISVLKTLSGKKHTVYTGISVIIRKNGIKKVYNKSSKCKVFFDDISEKEISDYVKSGDPKDKAGSYSIQGEFSKFVKKINGDYYTVVGLPVNLLYKILKKENLI